MAVGSITNKLADFVFATKRLMLGHNRVRRTRLYCVGTGKSGTHSIASMFSKTSDAGTNRRRRNCIEKILAWRTDKMSEAQFTEWLRDRDRRLALEVDSSTLNRERYRHSASRVPERPVCADDSRLLFLVQLIAESWQPIQTGDAPALEGDGPLSNAAPKLSARAGRHSQRKGFRPPGLYLADWAWHNAGVLDRFRPTGFW